MNSLLKHVGTYDGNYLDSFIPENPKNFQVLIYITVGPSDKPGGHDYTLSVCTPAWLECRTRKGDAVWGRHFLVVNAFDAEKIKKEIEAMILRCDRGNWADSSVVLSRYLAWEYEDYNGLPK